MDFKLSQDHQDIFDAAMKFAKNEIQPKAAYYDEKGEMPWEILEKAWELGFINTALPEDVGGNGFSAMDSVLIFEAMSYGCMGMATSMLVNDLALIPIVIGGTKDQKEKFLRPFTESYKKASFCLTEPDYGSDAAGIKTQFKDDGDSWIINGDKMWISNAGFADLFIVYGTIDPSLKHKGISCIVVEKGTEGIEVGKAEKKMGQCSADTRAVSFRNARVPKQNMIGDPGSAWKLAMKTLDHSRPLVAAMSLGGAQYAFDCSVQYAAQRKQFGTTLSRHQAIQMMIANMATKIECARLLVHKTAWLFDNGTPSTQLASSAKAFASDAVMEITTDAVQIHGGYGYSKEYPVEKLMRDAKLMQIYEGTSQIQRLVIAREVFASLD